MSEESGDSEEIETEYENEFAYGDVVQLKSGGPPMTVDEVPGDPRYGGPRSDYLCVWFRGATRENADFVEHLLRKYEPPSK